MPSLALSEGRNFKEWLWAVGKEVQVYFPEVGEQLDTPPPQKKRTQQKCVRWREEHLGTENNEQR